MNVAPAPIRSAELCVGESLIRDVFVDDAGPADRNAKQRLDAVLDHEPAAHEALTSTQLERKVVGGEAGEVLRLLEEGECLVDGSRDVL